MNSIKEIRNFFKFLFIDFEKNPKINSEEFLKKFLSYLYLILIFIFIFLICIKILIILIFNSSIEINYLNLNNFNYIYFFILNINFKLIFSFFFCHISLYISSFVSDYFKEFKLISFLLKISILLSGLNIYIYFITLNNIEIFNNFFNLIKLFNKI
jgi:hypothetical protein